VILKAQEKLIASMNDEEKNMLYEQNVEMQEFWEKSHSQQNYFISQYGAEILYDLNIKSLIKPDLKVLEIGVGSGHLVKYLDKRGCKIDAHDIAKNALDSIAAFCGNTYTPEEIPTIPVNHYDLIVSHLVAQHMNDSDLAKQIKWILEVLNKEGIFALQFLNFVDQPVNTAGLADDKSTQKGGHTSRTLSELLAIVESVGGFITYANRYVVHEEFSSSWYAVHIVREDYQGKVVAPSLPSWKKLLKKVLGKK
jgi:cyclopropane fatty-acyl-phospholipid synthase-like methyltransferase